MAIFFLYYNHFVYHSRHSYLLLLLFFVSNVNLYSQNDINDIAQQNAQATQRSIIGNGGQGIISGISFEMGILSMPRLTMDGGKESGSYFAVHTIGIIAYSNNFCLTTGIGVQRRKIVSRNFWDPGIYLKADINAYRNILYITPGIECILNSPWNVDWALDDFIQNYGSITSIDIIPQIGIGCNLGSTRFELVYKHGLNSFTDGESPSGYATQLGLITYLTFRFQVWF